MERDKGRVEEGGGEGQEGSRRETDRVGRGGIMERERESGG